MTTKWLHILWLNIKRKCLSMKKSWQGQIQDLNLGGKRSEFYKGHKCGDWFETCTDSRHGPGSQHSRSLYFYASFHVVHQLLLTKNCLKLIVLGPGKFCHAMSLWSSILQNMEWLYILNLTNKKIYDLHIHAFILISVLSKT